MSGTYTPATTGLYTLAVRNYRASAASTTLLLNYVDSIKLEAQDASLSVDKECFSIFYGTTATFDLDAGATYAGHDYWLWVGVSGTYPGIQFATGPEIPLNHDVVLDLVLANPGFPGTGFIGQFDGSGQAQASMHLKPPMGTEGTILYFTYVVLSPGGKKPVLMASNPVNMAVGLLN